MLVALTAALGLGACTAATSRPENTNATSAADVRALLQDARHAAQEYGRRHLGHFLDLDKKALLQQGLRLPDGIELRVRTEHDGYCIRSSASKLETSDEWAIATASSGIGGISGKDDCSI